MTRHIQIDESIIIDADDVSVAAIGTYDDEIHGANAPYLEITFKSNPTNPLRYRAKSLNQAHSIMAKILAD